MNLYYYSNSYLSTREIFFLTNLRILSYTRDVFCTKQPQSNGVKTQIGHLIMSEKTYEVPCIYNNLSNNSLVTARVPGSKSITNRALLLATLAEGRSTLHGVLFSDDSRHFLKCIQDLGFDTAVNEEAKTITVYGHGGEAPRRDVSLYVGSAGTAARFLTAYLGVSHGVYHMDASEQMRKRPMAPLLNSLVELGCDVIYPKTSDVTQEGHFPFTLHSNGFGKSAISIDIGHSSQFLSALLISACLSDDDFTIRIDGTHGMTYIEMTRRMMEQFGVIAQQTAPDTFVIKKGQTYKALDYQIEPDVSAACYFYAMSPLLHVPVMVHNVHFDSLQGDVEFIRILEQMGCSATDTPEGILVNPPQSRNYHGITVDMSSCSDQAITLAVIAPFADTPTTITGIGHIRFQESNRIRAIVTELTKMGIQCDETDSSVTIYPGTPKPSVVETYDDHRMAMGFSLIGLRSEGIVISDPDCCRKTFENYFDVLTDIIRTIQK